MSPLYVVTVVFNPRRWQSRYRLYRDFAKWVADSGVKLLTVEVSFGDRPHEVTKQEDPWHIQFFTKHEMWHKERALNLGMWHLSQLVPGWEYIAWMDADIKLARPDWSSEAVHLLQHYAVIQMFGEAVNLDPNNHVLWKSRSIARNFEDYGEIDWYSSPGVKEVNPYVRAGHPGLAWAFRRDKLNDVGGWLDICVNGSGDLHMAGCYAGQWRIAGVANAPRWYREAIRRYGERCQRHIRSNMSYMPGVAYHYWHGKHSERGYEDRGKLIRTNQYNPYTDIVLDSQGLYRWNLDDPRVMRLAVETRRSLSRRNEDSNEA